MVRKVMRESVIGNETCVTVLLVPGLESVINLHELCPHRDSSILQIVGKLAN